MPQSVGRQVGCAGNRFSRRVHHPTHLPHVEATSAHAQEQGRTGILAGERGATCRAPCVDGSGRGGAERHPPHLSALAQHRDEARRPIDVIEVEAHELRHPQPGGVQQLEQRGIAEVHRARRRIRRFSRPTRVGRRRRPACTRGVRPAISSVQDPRRVLLLEHSGKTRSLLRRAETGRGVLLDPPRSEALAEEPPYGCDPPCGRRRGRPGARHRQHPLPQIPGFDVRQRQSSPVRVLERGEQPTDVPDVRPAGVHGCSALQRQVRVEGLHRVDVRGVMQGAADEIARGGSRHAPRVALVAGDQQDDGSTASRPVISRNRCPSPSRGPSAARSLPVRAFRVQPSRLRRRAQHEPPVSARPRPCGRAAPSTSGARGAASSQ